MILKAGTYRFNDTPDLSLFEIPLIDNTENIDGLLFPFVSNEIQFNIISVNNASSGIENATFLGYLNTTNGTSEIVYNANDNIWNKDYQFFTIGEDVELIDEYANAIIKNTDYNEVNGIVTSPIAEIIYNGQTIAQLNAGETATLSCVDKKMVSDVVVKVNKIEEPVDDSIVGTWVFNDTLTDVVGEESYFVPIVFMSDGLVYNKLNIFFENPIVVNFAIIDNNNDDEIYTLSAYDSEWGNEAVKTVTFLTDTNDNAFKTLLKANATKQ